MPWQHDRVSPGSTIVSADRTTEPLSTNKKSKTDTRVRLPHWRWPDRDLALACLALVLQR